MKAKSLTALGLGLALAPTIATAQVVYVDPAFAHVQMTAPDVTRPRSVCLEFPSNIALVNGIASLDTEFQVNVYKNCLVLPPAPCDLGSCPELVCKVKANSAVVSDCE